MPEEESRCPIAVCGKRAGEVCSLSAVAGWYLGFGIELIFELWHLTLRVLMQWIILKSRMEVNMRDSGYHQSL